MNSIDFRFALGTTDGQRENIIGDLTVRYGAFAGGAGVENPYFSVQPNGCYVVILRDGENAENAVEEIKAIDGIDPQSVKIHQRK